MVDSIFSSRPALNQSMQKITKSFHIAFQGIVYALHSQRNMKIHFLCALSLLLFGMIVPFDFISRIILLFCIGHVLAAELINTALETTVDLVTHEYHLLAKIAKDAAAGAVLICAVTSACIFGVILYTDFNLILLVKSALLYAFKWIILLLICEGFGLFFQFSKTGSFIRIFCSLFLLMLLASQTQDFLFLMLAFCFVALSGYISLKKALPSI